MDCRVFDTAVKLAQAGLITREQAQMVIGMGAGLTRPGATPELRHSEIELTREGVRVNGIPTKLLPAMFHSSEILSVYVYFTVAADYEFVALAPTGERSTPAQVQVQG